MAYVLTVLSVFFLVSCGVFPGFQSLNKLSGFSGQRINPVAVNPTPSQDDPENENTDEEEEDRERSQRNTSQCGARSVEEGPEVELDDIERVTTDNVGSYKLSGKCSESDKIVEITVNGFELEENPACNRRKWEIFLDLTEILLDTEELEFMVRHGRGSNVECKTVRASFTCPKNYISVPKTNRAGAYQESFCVMKYEARMDRLGGNLASSEKNGLPAQRVERNQAINACRANGSRYDLITNEQWQSIAISIESEDQNWSSGRAGVLPGNSLNCGASFPSAISGSHNIEEWKFNRRTHVLSNGQIIWDFCGGVGEITKDRNISTYNFEGYIFEMKDARLRRVFGPRRSYGGTSSSTRRRNQYYWGLGYANLKEGGDLIIRGSFGRRGQAGIFSVNLASSDRYARNVGFRCIYHP